ncbi:recombinase family protein [Gimesia sp.]|uniref:recombinase family protein n=1 Tax=Gimesia sp. TaxID=2024833 RepID=UPI003A913EA3
MTRLIPTVAYLRMSNKDQKTSIPQQRKQITAYAKANGYEIVTWYIDDGKSGSREQHKRTEFTRMLSDSTTGNFEVILCLDKSRFGRLDSIEGAFAKQTLRNAGVILHTLLEGDSDWNTHTGRIVDSVLSEAQHEYSYKLGQKTLIGKLNTWSNGTPYGQQTPYGFSRKVVDDKCHIRIIGRREKFTKPKNWSQEFVPGDPDEVEVVQWLFETYANRDVGFRWLAADLNSRNIPSPTGKKWCAKTIQDILCNLRYIGDLPLGKRAAGTFWRLDGEEVVKSETTSVVRNSESLIKKNTHDGIVSRTLFDKVQRRIERRKQTNTHSHKSGGYLLKDVLYCGNCGKPLYGNLNRSGKNTEKKKSGRIIYVCKTAIKYGKQCSCAQWKIEEDLVLPFLKQKLLEGIDKIVLKQSAMKLPKLKKVKPNEVELKMSKLDDLIERGTKNLLLASAEHLSQLDKQLSELKAERAELEKVIEQAKNKKSRHPFIPSDEWIDVLRERRQLFEGLRGQLVDIETGKSRDGKYSRCFHLNADTFRELLISHDCRVDFWWDRKSKHRWKVSKIRVRAFGQNAQFETIASLIV